MSPGFAVALIVVSLVLTFSLNARAINRRRDRARDDAARERRRSGGFPV